MRRFVTANCIFSLLAGLVYGPFFHVHFADDDAHHSDHKIELHAHFPLAGHSREADSPDEESIALEPAKAGHGKPVATFTIEECPFHHVVVDAADKPHLIRPAEHSPYQPGVAVCSHDPPERRSSPPRSPPVLSV